MANPLYIIKDWDRNFENSESRKIKNLSWAPFQNRHDSAPFRRVAALKNSPEIFAAWVLIVQVASKMPTRGKLENSGGPLTVEDLALMTGFPERIFKAAFEELQKPGIQWILADFPASPDALGDSPGIHGHVGAEQKGTEGNRTELNGREKKRKEEGFARLDVWFQNSDFCEAWEEWVKFRNTKNPKLTSHAKTLNFAELKRLAGDSVGLATKIVNKSIERSWKGFFVLPADNQSNYSKKTESYAVQPEYRVPDKNGNYHVLTPDFYEESND